MIHEPKNRLRGDESEMTLSLQDQVAVVTGGASGIGEACARLFAIRGARVVVADRREARAAEVASDIGGVAMAVDVARNESVEALATRVEAEVGPTDILVTSAGIAQNPVPPENLPLETYDRVLEVDLRGTYLSCLAFGPRMARRGRGSIITIASITGMRSTPLHSYGPAKAAVINLTAGLAAEWGRSGVRVNTVSPGYTLTPLLRHAIEQGRRDPAILAENSALGRMVEPDEIARAVAFLASAEASAITGINLPVDAGWLTAGPWHTYGGVRPARPPEDSGA
jgi:NAD(P)-dependent dehydrogenase (short-subunit alcohol dehydrogenase family)